MAMRSRLGAGYVADELGDEVGADPLIHQHLEVSWTHRGALLRIHAYDTLFILRVEVIGHVVEPLDLAAVTGKHKHLEHLTAVSRELDRLRRTDVHTVGCLDRELAARDRNCAGTRAHEDNHVTRSQAHNR